VVGLLGLAGVVVTGVLTYRVLNPPATPLAEIEGADVLVVLSGAPERWPTAVTAFEQGAAPRRVAPLPRESIPGAEALCGSGSIECFIPNPVTTVGEARTASALANERGWRHLAVVTSDYHVSRARMVFTQCFSGDITMIAARARYTQSPTHRA
jgi:uncharacterized SAM-binding protein YcdF (DUF218 family)